MEDYRLEQTGQQVQDILNGAAMDANLQAEVERATDAEGTLQGNIDAEERARQDADGLLQQGISDEENRAKRAEEANAGEIEGIKALIPATASDANKLADTNYVNSSIQTATAEYRGDYNVVTDLHLAIDATHAQIETLLGTVIAEADKNDYCYVMIPTNASTPTEIAKIERYKMTSEGWKFEYDVNNSTFTAEEWAAIKSGITSGLVAKLNALPTNADLLLLLAGKQDVLTFDSVPVPESNNPVKSGGIYSAIDDEKTARLNSDTAIHAELDGLQAKVPATASSDNKLVDQNQMNTSISTATATFRGDWNVVSDLHLAVDATRAQIAALLPTVIITADNNDYCYVEIPTSSETPTQIERVERFKYNGTAWAYEYVLNNSGFTADQWAAINSMITSGLVAKLSALPTNADLLAMLAQKQDNLTFDTTPTENSQNPVTSGGVFAADKALSDAIEAILLLIPSAASALNKLVDTSLMNSSISTATATFRGTYNLVSDLGLGIDATREEIAAALLANISTADNNDYAFVQIPTSAQTPAQIARTDRYKFNGTAWAFEYTLNTSGFTAAQWAAINSTITSALVAKLNALPTAAELQEALGTLTSSITDINQKIPSTASQSNKLVDNASIESYIAQVINTLDATFNITSTDGHITLHITQVDGVITSVQVQSTDIASAADLALKASQADLTALASRVTTAEGNITSLTGRMGTAETNIANLQQLYNNLQQSKPVPVTALPSTGQQQGVIYRLAGTTSYSDYMWNGSSWFLMATYNNAIDPRPKKASQNLVTSGGVFDNMGALDVSELNATENPHTLAQYADLSAALAAIPTDYQKGGMSVKFVSNSDNKYVQYRLMSDTFNTTVANWQGVDDEPTPESKNLATSGGIEYAIKDSLVGLNAEVYGNKVQLIGNGIRGGYIDADGIFHENNSYVLFNISTCRGMHITMTEGTSTQYAFLKDYNSERVSFVSGGGRVSGTLNNTEIPSDALYLYMYTGAYSTAIVPTLEISESTVPGILSLLNEKRVITGNIYKSHTQISSISDVLSSIPTNIRLGNSILVFRDKDYQIHVFVFKSDTPSDTNWNNVSLWVEFAKNDDVELVEHYIDTIIDNNNVIPLVFNKASESVVTLDNNIVLSQDGDSIELSVKTNCPYVDGGSNTPAGYGFALSKEEHGIGIGLSANRIAIRADDTTWILRGGSTEPYYNPQKNTYVLKISYESGNILTYVDGNLVNTYTGQKTITIKSFGNGANLTYGYWDGIIYWLKVNGKIYNIPYLSSMSNVEKVECIYPDMLFEKTADSINVYRRLDGDNYIKYPILKAYKSYTEGEYPSFYDNWGLRQVSKCKFDGISTITNVEALFRDGEAECAIAVQRGANYGASQYPYVGGSAHGFENIKVTDGKRHFIIMVDNSSIRESDVVQLKAVKNVQIKQESSLYQAYTNSSPWGEVVKKWTFDDSGIFIETKIKWLRDILVYKCQQGMMCVYRHWLCNTSNTYLTNKAAKDNEYVVYNVEDGWESEPVNAPLKNVDNGCNKITEWGQKGLGFSLEIIDDNRAESGGMDVGTNDSSYNKIYFSTINNIEVAIISSGTIHYATQKWEIYKN